MNLTEIRLLRIAVAIGSLVPIGAGIAGVILGPRLTSQMPGPIPADLDSHFRYLSGLLLAIGLGYASTIPRIEAHSARFQTLTLIVVTGGVGRLISWVAIGAPSTVMAAALVMELAVTPSLAIWQRRVARMAS
jgi:hypothetical protein